MSAAQRTLRAAMRAVPARARLSFGLIADVQYADAPDGTSFDKSEFRSYRAALAEARRAAATWAGAASAEDAACAEGGVAFVLQLGDLIDGLNSRRHPPSSDAALAEVLAVLGGSAAPLPQPRTEGPLSQLMPPVLHCIGNHELLNWPRAEAVRRLPLPAAVRGGAAVRVPPCARAADALYYDVQLPGNWRLVVLDAYDVALSAHAAEAGSPRHAAAYALLRANNPNACARGEGTGDYFAGLPAGPAQRWVPFNGGIGADQMAWLATTLREARAARESVIVAVHVGAYDGVAVGGAAAAGSSGSAADPCKCLLFNFREVLATLHAAGNVALVLSGHFHKGAAGVDEHGVTHLTLESPLTHPLRADGGGGAHATVHLHDDCIVIEGRGAVASRTVAARRPPD